MVLLALGLLLPTAAGFGLPVGMLGLWSGPPSSSIMGPWVNNITFGVQRSVSGDYLLGENINYDLGNDEVGNPAPNAGQQHFYVEGFGEDEGALWYCGVIANYFAEPANAGKCGVHWWCWASHPSWIS